MTNEISIRPMMYDSELGGYRLCFEDEKADQYDVEVSHYHDHTHELLDSTDVAQPKTLEEANAIVDTYVEKHPKTWVAEPRIVYA